MVQLHCATLSALFASEKPTSLEEVVDLEAAVSVTAVTVMATMVSTVVSAAQ